jgi:histidinol-phosphate aminotransferase
MHGSSEVAGMGGRLACHMTRRQFGRMTALLTAGAALPFYNESTLAQDIKAIANVPPDAVRLNANENPLGPCPAALEAIRAILPSSGRYLFGVTREFAETLAAVEGVSVDHVLPCAGSSDPLHRSVIAFTSPRRPLVIANPGYEAPASTAQFMGARVIQVPLREDYAHDAPAMARADANAGLIYVCNPNNPTGTVTRKEDILAIVADKPEGCMVLIDEAYLHFSAGASGMTELVAAGKDVIVLRSFSKLFGMAGLRAGAVLARPDVLEKLRGFGGLPIVPATAMAAATASLNEKNLVAERREILADMLMIDGKRPGKVTAAAMLDHKVAIGRTWAALPTHVRVTIGTHEEMGKFKAAFQRVMQA